MKGCEWCTLLIGMLLFVLLFGGVFALVIHTNMYPDFWLQRVEQCYSDLIPTKHIPGNIDDLSMEQILCNSQWIFVELRGVSLFCYLMLYISGWIYIIVHARRASESPTRA